MKLFIFLKIVCISFVTLLALSTNYVIADETNRKQTNDPLISLKLPEVVQEIWEIQLSDLPNIYPGGHLNVGDPAKRVVSNYLFDAFFTDLKVEALLSFHHALRTNYVQNVPSKLIKSITIYSDSEQGINDLIYKIKTILRRNFPEGGPSMKNEKQVGYFIPTDSDFNGINIAWSTGQNSKKKYLQFVIQKTK